MRALLAALLVSFGPHVGWTTGASGPTHSAKEPAIRLSLARARHLPCCDGEWELAGTHGAYSVIVRIYFGSPPTRAMRSEAAQALARLRLPR